MLISVLVVTYNAQDFIRDTLQSIFVQTIDTIEILVLDNNSTDATRDILLDIEKRDKRIQIFHSNQNLGPYRGLNFLLKKAKGDFVAIQDHDDLWHPEKLAKQIQILEKYPEMVGCGTNTIMFFEENNSYFEYKFPRESYYTLHPSLVFRGKKDYQYLTEELYMGDAYFQKNTLCKGEKKIFNLEEPLTFHRIKKSYSNASFSWFRFNISCIKQLFLVHGITFYSFLALGFELIRKTVYPVLRLFNGLRGITILEQLPFRILGYKIQKSFTDFVEFYHSKISNKN